MQAELVTFKAFLEKGYTAKTVASYTAGASDLLVFLHQKGRLTHQTTAADFRGFQRKLQTRVDRGALTRPTAERILNAARCFLREKARRGELSDATLVPLIAPGDFALLRSLHLAADPDRAGLVREVEAFHRHYRALGYRSSYRSGVLAFLVFLQRRGRALRDLTATDWIAFRSEVGKDSHSLDAAGAYLRMKAKQGELRADQVPRALRPKSLGAVLPAGLAVLPRLLEEGMEASGFSVTTKPSYTRGVRDFLLWLCEEEGITELSGVTREVITAYRLRLASEPSRRGTPYAVHTQLGALTALRFFFGWLAKTGRLLADPTIHLPSPRSPQRLPRTLKVEQVAYLIRSLPKTTIGLRDRALLEVVYGTGMRRAELARLRLDDLDLEQATLLIREGKGRKDRLVPLGKKARQALLDYLDLSRVKLVRGEDPGALFLGLGGRRLSAGQVSDRIHALGAKVGLKVRPHILRHSCATHLLKGRADIRHIQRLLGHRSLATTEAYTKVEVADLKAVIERCHPREKKP